MDNRPIGVFDSGLGGLTALRALKRLMPDESFIYFADSGRAPYGSRPAEQLRTIARQDVEFLLSRGVKAVFAACGTVSSVAPDVLAACEVPACGVLTGTVDALEKLSPKSVGILATPASIKSGAFERAVSARCPDIDILTVGCTDFAPLIEQGHFSADDPIIAQRVEEYLHGIKAGGVEAIVLGCTHYGIISDAIAGYMGRDVRILEASECAAESMRELIIHNSLQGTGGVTRYFTSGDVGEFVKLSSVFLGEGTVSRVEHVPPMEVI